MIEYTASDNIAVSDVMSSRSFTKFSNLWNGIDKFVSSGRYISARKKKLICTDTVWYGMVKFFVMQSISCVCGWVWWISSKNNIFLFFIFFFRNPKLWWKFFNSIFHNKVNFSCFFPRFSPYVQLLTYFKVYLWVIGGSKLMYNNLWVHYTSLFSSVNVPKHMKKVWSNVPINQLRQQTRRGIR